MKEVKRTRNIPPAVKASCLDAYLNTTKTIKQIAKDHDISYGTMYKWHQAEKWPEIRKGIEKDLCEKTISQCTKLAAKERVKVMKRHLEAASGIDEAIIKKLNLSKNPNARDLADLGKALKSSGDVASRVVGLDMRPEERKLQMNILINTNYAPQPSKRKKAINVVPLEDEEPPF